MNKALEMNRKVVIKLSQTTIPVDPTIAVNPNDPTSQQKLRKANAFVKAFPGVTGETARNGVNH